MAHREKQRAVAEVAGKQPEPVITQIQHNAALGQLWGQLSARHDGDRAAMRRLLRGADRRAIQRGKFPAREKQVPCGKKDQRIASAGVGYDCLACRAIGLGAVQTGLRLLDEGSDPADRFFGAR